MSGHELDGLMKFVRREPWATCFDEVFDAHLGTVLDRLQLDFEGLTETLGEHHVGILMGCILEDFLTREFEVEGGNIADDYLKRRGFTESTGSKAYIKALRSSVMSLYEVGEVMPGKSFVAHDLVRGGNPVVVSELTASKTLQPGAKLAARLVPVLGRNTMAGGFLVYTATAQEKLFSAFRDGFGHDDETSLPSLTDEELRELAPTFTMAWLIDTLGDMADEIPDLRNSDGEALVFHHIRFPFAAGVTQKTVDARLGDTPGFDSYRARFWAWLEGGVGEAPAAMARDGGHTVRGDIELKGRCLHLFVNSATRAREGVAAIQQSLGHLVTAPTIDIIDPEDMMANRLGGGIDADDSDVSPELVEQAVHQVIERHYKASLDMSIAMLGHKTPRQAAQSADGRRDVANWLTHLEDEAAKNGRLGSPIGTYDFQWMWRELGVEDLRL